MVAIANCPFIKIECGDFILKLSFCYSGGTN